MAAQSNMLPLNTKIPAFRLRDTNSNFHYSFTDLRAGVYSITEITPSRGFAAEFGAATTILLGSKLGLPLSTTHTVVGAVVGVGFARGMNALNLGIIVSIIKSWVYTIPVAAVLTIVLYFIMKGLWILFLGPF